MNFFEQMAVKLLTHVIQHLGLLLNETLCVEPDRQTIRALLESIRKSLDEFEDAYFTQEDNHKKQTHTKDTPPHFPQDEPE